MGNNCCFNDCCNVGVHLDVDGLICFQLDLMIETVELYIFILVSVTFIFIKVTGIRESKNFCANFLKKFFIDLDGSWYTVQSYWFDECCMQLISFNQYSRKRTLLI